MLVAAGRIGVGVALVLSGVTARSARVTLVVTLGAGGSATACIASTASSAASAVAVIAVIAAIRVDRGVEVNVGLALLDGFEHGSLSAAASHEVELGVVEQVLELLARLPLNLHLGDVLRRKLVGSLCTLGAEQHEEVTQVAQTDLLAFEQHLSHAVHCHVEDGADVSSRIHTAVRSDVLGKLLDGHHIGVLRDGERILLLRLHEVKVLLIRILTLLLSLVDA